MLETLIATLGVLFAPTLAQLVPMSGGFVMDIILNKVVIFSIIVLVTLLTNIIQAYRYCRNSTGIVNGLKKGILSGIFSVAGLMITILIPLLRIPFLILSFIPYLNMLIDGCILATIYIIFNTFVTYPIWGSC